MAAMNLGVLLGRKADVLVNRGGRGWPGAAATR